MEFDDDFYTYYLFKIKSLIFSKIWSNSCFFFKYIFRFWQFAQRYLVEYQREFFFFILEHIVFDKVHKMIVKIGRFAKEPKKIVLHVKAGYWIFTILFHQFSNCTP
jgi:hypothetical protein